MKRLTRQVGLCLSALLLAAAAQARETTNKYGITMVDIPAGSFLMGSCKVTSGEADRMFEENKKRVFMGQAPLTASLDCDNTDADALDSEAPQHRVNIKAFQIGKYEVTLGQFKKFIASASRTDLLTDAFIKQNSFGDEAPVLMVNWHQAQNFISWLNKTDGGGWRLPSEAEWEYACRAGKQHKFCGGDDPSVVGWIDGVRGKFMPVGQKQPNAFGLYDMSGNASEWVQDCWHSSYHGAPTDGSAWITQCPEMRHSRGSYGETRVARGGNTFFGSTSARSAQRTYYPAFWDTALGYGVLEQGFRLARTR